MAEVVNLNKIRKAKARAADDSRAQANRIEDLADAEKRKRQAARASNK